MCAQWSCGVSGGCVLVSGLVVRVGDVCSVVLWCELGMCACEWSCGVSWGCVLSGVVA